MSLLLIELDPQLAGHVAIALHRHKALLRERGRREPEGLAELLDAATRAATPGQARTGPATDARSDLDGLYGRDVPDFLTPAAVAAALDRSERTVRRRCAAGALPGAFREGRAWRIPADALKSIADGVT